MVDTNSIKADIFNIMHAKHAYEKAVMYKKHGHLPDSTIFYHKAYKAAIVKVKGNANKQEYLAYINHSISTNDRTLLKQSFEYTYTHPTSSFNEPDNYINFRDYLKVVKYCFFDNDLTILPTIYKVREILYDPEAEQLELYRKDLINVLYSKNRYEKSILFKLADTVDLKKAYKDAILLVKEKNKRNEYLKVIAKDRNGSEKGVSVLPYRYLLREPESVEPETRIPYEDYFIGIKYYFFDNNYSELPSLDEFKRIVGTLK